MNIQRLLVLAGFIGRRLDQIVKLTFVNGSPESTSVALQQLPGINEMDISELIPTAKVLMVNKTQEVEMAATGKQSQASYREETTQLEGQMKPFRTCSSISDARNCTCHMTVKIHQNPNQPVLDVVRQGIL